MPQLTDAQLAKATQLFLAQNPPAVRDIMSITQADADILGESLEELRRIRIFKLIADYARERRRDSAEVLYTLAAESPEEFQRLWEEHQAENTRAIGLE